MIIILIIINILVSLFYTKKVKTVVNPCLILSTMWVVIISFYNIFCNSILGQIEETTYFIVLFGLLLFQIGVILQFCYIRKRKYISENNEFFNYKTLKYITFFNVIGYFFYLHRLYLLTNTEFNEFRVFERIKLIHSYRSEEFGILNNFLSYIIVFWVFLLILLVLHKLKFNKYVFINFLIGIIYFILVGKRLALIVPILSVTIAKILKYRWQPKQQLKILGIISLLFSLSMVYFFFLHKKFSNTITAGITAIIPYFGMPLKNLDIVIKEELYKNDFILPNFLRFFYAILNKIFNRDIEVFSTLKDYLTVGNFTSNIYTTYFSFFEDFGYGGIIFQFLLGNIFGYIFKNREKLNYFVIYCLWIEVLLLQYAADAFFIAFSMRIQQIVYVYILSCLLLKKNKKRRNE
ncbi:oligosaccharide repeat unit polymerase [Fusobacterium sp. CM21]|uniref:O-antigen polymerase n=1 Tax=Fusobacterium nucleatum TaxID=851 RepID=UPI0003E2A82A|nr:O-antigen polymerase [Fusobacterium nucleatum]ETT12267.1 oligosaccharide repeat unit polymerase [Fusobacterium sp. CM21]OHU81704.1 hypothetical protein BKN39_07780 [Fusobacterium nucleatum]